MSNSFDKSFDTDFAQQQLQKLLGKHLLVRISRTNDQGKIILEEIVHGSILAADPLRGIKVQVAETGKTMDLPLDPKTIEMARFRDFELTDTGKKITSVDFTMSVTLPKAP